MSELVRRGLVVLLVVLVAMRVIVGDVARPAPRSPARPPRGLEWRTIKRLPAGRIFALRLQVVIA